jgi:hypothetical protein
MYRATKTWDEVEKCLVDPPPCIIHCQGKNREPVVKTEQEVELTASCCSKRLLEKPVVNVPEVVDCKAYISLEAYCL